MLMQLICKSGSARQTLQEACRVARQFVYDEYLVHVNVDKPDNVQEDILVNDDNALFEFLEKDFNPTEQSIHENAAAYKISISRIPPCLLE